jgi:hypothetical protein
MRLVFVAILLVACGPAKPMNGPSMNNHMNPENEPEPPSSLISEEILARDPLANHTVVKHILIGWRDLADAYGGRDKMDPRAAGRTKEEAEALVRSLLKQLDGGADFDTLMVAHSEDPGAITKPDGYDVTPDAGLVIEFRALGLRLVVGEIGVVQSDYGFHIMKRVK